MLNAEMNDFKEWETARVAVAEVNSVAHECNPGSKDPLGSQAGGAYRCHSFSKLST